MAKNENKEKTGKFTKHDLWCIIVGAICVFCWAFFRGKGWLDWLYNLAPKLETEVVDSVVAVVFILACWAVSAIYGVIRKKKEK